MSWRRARGRRWSAAVELGRPGRLFNASDRDEWTTILYTPPVTTAYTLRSCTLLTAAQLAPTYRTCMQRTAIDRSLCHLPLSSRIITRPVSQNSTWFDLLWICCATCNNKAVRHLVISGCCTACYTNGLATSQQLIEVVVLGLYTTSACLFSTGSLKDKRRRKTKVSVNVPRGGIIAVPILSWNVKGIKVNIRRQKSIIVHIMHNHCLCCNVNLIYCQRLRRSATGRTAAYRVKNPTTNVAYCLEWKSY